MNAAKEFLAEVNGRAITAFLRASGGQATIHAKMFGWSPTEHSRAVRRLSASGRIEKVGECEWRLVA